jgi:hypothetical protein
MAVAGAGKKVAPVEYRVQGSERQLAIPRESLGLKTGGTKTAIDFQWGTTGRIPAARWIFTSAATSRRPAVFIAGLAVANHCVDEHET